MTDRKFNAFFAFTLILALALTAAIVFVAVHFLAEVW